MTQKKSMRKDNKTRKVKSTGKVNINSPVPKYTINQTSNFSTVVIQLTNKGYIKVESNALHLSKEKKGNPVKVITKSGGVISGLKRKLLTGEHFFHNYLTAPSEGSPVEITIGTPLPGDIIDLTLKPGQTYLIKPGSFLASTPNIKMTTKFGGIRGAFMNHTFLTRVSNIGTDAGVVFISCLGTSQIIDVGEDEDLLMDKGLFLAAEYEKDKTLFKISRPFRGVKSFFFGGEGLYMRFKGKKRIYSQNGNALHYAKKVAAIMAKQKGSKLFKLLTA